MTNIKNSNRDWDCKAGKSKISVPALLEKKYSQEIKGSDWTSALEDSSPGDFCVEVVRAMEK